MLNPIYFVLITGVVLIILGLVIAGTSNEAITNMESISILVGAQELPPKSSTNVALRLLEGEDFFLTVGSIPKDVLLHAVITDPFNTILFEGAFSDTLSIPVVVEYNGEYNIAIGNLDEKSATITAVATPEEFDLESDVFTQSLIQGIWGIMILVFGIILMILSGIIFIILRLRKKFKLQK